MKNSGDELTHSDSKRNQENVEFLKRVAPYKRRLDSAFAEIRNINEQGRLAVSNRAEVDQFKGMFRALERYFSKFETIWDEITDLYDQEGIATQFPNSAEALKRTNTQRYYYEANTNFERLCVTPMTTSNPNVSSFSDTIRHKNLPSIKVPDFYGDITQWPKFRDIYLSLVHNDESMSSSLKFQYLKSALKGPAASIIASFSIEDDNHYPLAWKAVTTAYNNKRILATAYLNQVLDFKPSQGKPTVESFRQFRSKISDSISAFKLLKIENESEFILFHLASKALDPSSREQFEIAQKGVEFPTFELLDTFVSERCLALQLASGTSKHTSSETSQSQFKHPNSSSQKSSRRMALISSGTQKAPQKKVERVPCFLCKDNSYHHLLSCPRYDNARAIERVAMLKDWTGCINCLSPHHSVKACKSNWHCRFCPAKHHSSLHQHTITTGPAQHHSRGSSSNQRGNPPADQATLSHSSTAVEASVLLGTAIAEVKDARGRFQKLRIVVDSGSQNSFIAKRCLDRLGLHSSKFPKTICGIGQTILEGAKGKTSVRIRPINCSSPELVTEAIVVTNITSFLPTVTLPTEIRNRYTNYSLADPTFWQSRPVDFLLGADLFTEICTGSTITFEEGFPRLFSSVFGHIVMGRYFNDLSSNASTTLFTLQNAQDLTSELRRFWELEEPNAVTTPISPEDEKCEAHFTETHYRLSDGRYVVRLPFKESPPTIGDSTHVALQRFRNLERKLDQNIQLRLKYCEFMAEYLSMDHMALATTPSKFLIPHHSVVKRLPDNDIKLRVVFDGSVNVPPSSLNEQLLAGPKLQNDMRDILLGFRRHNYVFITDIVKMYRMILVDELDWPFQHILWRASPSDAISTFALKTVTYGLSCAPYLALRVIKQLGIDEGHRFPLANQALSRDIYVDDLVTGANSVKEVCELQQQVLGLMNCAGFRLSKWASNCPEVMKAVQTDSNNTPVSLSSHEDQTVKILGLQWDPTADLFIYSIKPPEIIYTKRAILSTIARIYDPLGFVTPVTLHLKSFIQELWKLGLDWDQPIPEVLKQSWRDSVEQLPAMSEIRVPRYVSALGDHLYQVIGFADSSCKAYCAAIYLRVQWGSNIQVSLLTAKSKLAPVKSATIPRLELCGAALLASLFRSISGFLELLEGRAEKPVFFTDSTIVLSWLNTPPYQLKTYVSNRVVRITESLPVSCWRHIPSEENPADVGSRGAMPGQLVNHNLWWKGPSWLTLPSSEWPKSIVALEQDLSELKPTTTMASTTLHNLFISWMSRFSSYNRLIRSVAWLNRWLYNLKHVGCCCCRMLSGPLTLREIQHATQTCILVVQRHHFFHGKDPTEHAAAKVFPNLAPFLDETKVLRVGGRLHSANIPLSHKHPILLPNNCHFTELLIDYFHRSFLHPGPTQLQALIQARYWIPSLRRMVRKRGFMCITCYRSRGKVMNQMMGNLPQYRLEGGRAFIHTGVDFAGPFIMRDSLRRKAQVSKVYLCVYVCMATKAVHLETVTQLTTEAFLASFQRFTARRGLPGDVYSDNGSNFIGAARLLRELSEWFRDSASRNAINDYAITSGLTWHFNPPQTPHMGGIWEAGVKSVKQRLHTLAGDTPLTYEELSTLFTRIEASLNSRPLCPVSSSPDDMDYLTPGHFLVGGPLHMVPEHSVLNLKENVLSRWQLVQRIHEQFWSRWRLEYMSTLQKRIKWQRKVPNLEVGDLVLLNDDSPPFSWPMARVTAVHPGKDSLVRVITVRTPQNSLLKRHVSRCTPILPLLEPSYESEP